MRPDYYELRNDALTLAVEYVTKGFNNNFPVLEMADLFKCYLEEDIEGVNEKKKEIIEGITQREEERQKLETEFMKKNHAASVFPQQFTASNLTPVI